MLVAAIQQRVTPNIYQQNQITRQQNPQVSTPSFQKGSFGGIVALGVAILSALGLGFLFCKQTDNAVRSFKP